MRLCNTIFCVATSIHISSSLNPFLMFQLVRKCFVLITIMMSSFYRKTASDGKKISRHHLSQNSQNVDTLTLRKSLCYLWPKSLFNIHRHTSDIRIVVIPQYFCYMKWLVSNVTQIIQQKSIIKHYTNCHCISAGQPN